MMKAADLVMSKDGSLSLTKLAAATFHLNLAITVVYITAMKQEFMMEMWMLYASVSIGHATYDKTLATIKDVKDKKLAAENQNAS